MKKRSISQPQSHYRPWSFFQKPAKSETLIDIGASLRGVARRQSALLTKQPNSMLFNIAIVLIILWLLGFITSSAIGGFIHILLVVAIILILVNFISGPKRS
jgi:hypothetical protein